MINRLPWRKKLRTSAANNLDKINEIVDYINHSDISPVALSESGSGRSVTVGVSSSLKSLDVYGESIQDGTPTPDVPVDVQVVEAPTGGQFGILVGDTMTPIDLQGHVLASLPDGTHDRLLIDSAGHKQIDGDIGIKEITSANVTSAVISTSYSSIMHVVTDIVVPTGRDNIMSNMFRKVSGMFSSNSYNGEVCGVYSNGTVRFNIGVSRLSEPTLNGVKAWVDANKPLFYYPLPESQLIDLGYIDMPAIESGDAISVSASIVPVIDAAWWCYDDVTDIIRDLKTYVDYKTVDEQDPTAELSMSRPDNISLDTQADQPAIVEESEMI